VPERRFSDEQVDAALRALQDPGRFREAEARIARFVPQLQHVLAQALHEGGWFGEAQETEVRKAVKTSNEAERAAAIRTLLAEETRMGMLVGVAVGWELARELELKNDDEGGH
jgi:hypothetical protein